MFTLQRRGLVSLNHAAFKALGEPVAVVLLYDPDEGVVAMRKVVRTHANAYHVRKQQNSQSYLVGAQGFASHHKIPTDVARRFAGHDYGDQIWGFALDEGSEVHGRRRASDSDEDTERS